MLSDQATVELLHPTAAPETTAMIDITTSGWVSLYLQADRNRAVIPSRKVDGQVVKGVSAPE